ncbi:MAG: EamA family transporter [archaeon]
MILTSWWILALLSAFFSAFAAILEKKILFKNSALSMTFVLGIFNMILAFPFLFFVDYSLVTLLGLIVLAIKSVLGAAAFICVMFALKNLEISKALPMLVLTPGLVAVFAWITLGESLSVLEISGMILLLVGTYILQLGKQKGFFDPWKNLVKTKGNYYVLAALLIFTVTSILDKAILKNYNVPVNALLGFEHLFFAIVFFSLVIVYSKKSEVKSSFRTSWRLIGFLAIITITYRFTQLSAVKIAPVALVLAIKRISVFFAVLVGGAYFKDENLVRRVIATALMVGGAVMVILG